MPYRNKTYVCFDADNDIRYYRLMKAWNAKDNIDFNFHNAHELNNLRNKSSEVTIKGKLRERLKNTKLMIVLIGESTKNLYKFVRWEIEIAMKMEIPIIAVNLNGKKSQDNSLCPPILKDKLAVHVPYKQNIIQYSIDNWIAEHNRWTKEKDFSDKVWKESVYDKLKK